MTDIGTTGTETTDGGVADLDMAALAAAILTGLRMLGDLRALHPQVTSGDLERGLRDAVSRLIRTAAGPGAQAGHPAVAAVRAACAYLATRSHEDAYLALLTAHGLMPRSRSRG
jgi:hypothetical protein